MTPLDKPQTDRVSWGHGRVSRRARKSNQFTFMQSQCVPSRCAVSAVFIALLPLSVKIGVSPSLIVTSMKIVMIENREEQCLKLPYKQINTTHTNRDGIRALLSPMTSSSRLDQSVCGT